MQARMGLMFEQWMQGDVSAEDLAFLTQRLPAYRTELIARTETVAASNFASHTLHTAWGVQSRSWLATQDDRTRDSHAVMDGVSKPIGQKFSVGGHEADYPGDPSLPIEERANCRCATIPDM
jgi:uncharacterized protein with gpF-like domain